MNGANKNVLQLPGGNSAEQIQPSTEQLVNEAQILKLSLQRMLELSKIYMPVSGLEA